MGKKQDALVELLDSEGSLGQHRRPNRQDLLRAGLLREVGDVYRGLGGLLDEVPTRVGNWDTVFNEIAVELDEQLHFNRYRLRTLQSPLYRQLPAFPRSSYEQLCREHESACLRAGSYGGKWTNRSCEKQFGSHGAAGDLTGAGAPRWKQRAFYDFLKDLAPLSIELRVARVSIWERLPGDQARRNIEECLKRPAVETGGQLAALIRVRAGSRHQ